MANALVPIAPAPARDFRSFDFTTGIGAIPGVITAVQWACTIEPYSPVLDDTPQARIVGTPTFSGYVTQALLGDMLDRAIYQLQATANLVDGRVLVLTSEMLCAAEPSQQPPVVIDSVVQFDYYHFISNYPEFASLDPEVLQGYWDEAGLLFRNDSTCPEPDYTIRREILELLTAHCASLFAPAPVGRGGSSMVGIITSKSVNGVSLSGTPFGGVSGTAQWYLQSQYGAKAWKLMAAYRTMHYLPPLYAHLPRRASLPYPYSWRW